MISTILKSVNMIVDSIIKDKRNVVIHCSDGWGRTAQLCSLSQILIEPYYRTLIGFIVLIEKDWIQFGH